MSQTIVGRVLSDAVSFFLILLFIRWIAELILGVGRVRPAGWALPILEITYTVTDPPLRFLRRLIPPLRVGNVPIDLAWIVLVIALYAVRSTVLQRI
jgi:YggT family protein